MRTRLARAVPVLVAGKACETYSAIMPRGVHPRGPAFRRRTFHNARSLFVRALSSARRLAADGGAPGSLRSRRVPISFSAPCYCFFGFAVPPWEPPLRE